LTKTPDNTGAGWMSGVDDSIVRGLRQSLA